MTGFPPSVDDGPTDRRGLRVLDLEECLSRTAHRGESSGQGRAAVPGVERQARVARAPDQPKDRPRGAGR